MLHLSETIKESINEVDLLKAALSEKIVLSVFLVHPEKATPCKAYKKSETSTRGFEPYLKRRTEGYSDSVIDYVHDEDEFVTVEGIYDLSMFGSEYTYVAQKVFNSNEQDNVKARPLGAILKSDQKYYKLLRSETYVFTKEKKPWKTY